MDKNLRLALEREEFSLVYQPLMEIESGRINGFEALIRWNHPEIGLIPPDRFISIAENNGLILPIGEWALRTACTQARRWQDEGLRAVPVAVNVSAVQFRQENFLGLIRRALQETGLAPEYPGIGDHRKPLAFQRRPHALRPPGVEGDGGETVD